MSVIVERQNRSRRLLSWWPLIVFILCAIVAAVWLWQIWPQVMLKSVLWQRDIHSQMSVMLKSVAQHPGKTGGSLLLFSFIYGVLHALGPGHGKVVITTWLATHPSKLKSALSLTLASALLQGVVAIGLVVVVLTVLALPARQLHLSGYWLEKGSYLLVGVLGMFLCWRGVKKLVALLRKPSFRAFSAPHVHHDSCGCAHQHLPSPEQIQSGERLMVVLSMGMRPCSGAIMVLLFSKVVGVFAWGIASALAMAAGTALTISALALLVHSFRQWAMKLSGKRPTTLWRQVGWNTLSFAGGVLLIGAALVMWFSVLPPGGGLRVF
ncbi:nickel/cobalt transporter [Salmonella enterica]